MKAQNQLIDNYNKNKTDKKFNVEDKVFVIMGNKLSPLFEEGTIEADLGTTVLIKGRVVHKDNLR